MAKVTISTIDRQSLQTSLTIPADDAVGTAAVQALADAMDAVIRGAAVGATITVPEIVDAGSAVPPADTEANRGNKWLFRTQVAAENKIFTNELGTADNSQLASSTDDFLDLTAGVGLALKTAWDAVYESPAGNAGVLISVQQVNRGD